MDAIYWMNRGWNEVEARTIIRFFEKCGFQEKVEAFEAMTMDASESSSIASVVEDLEDYLPVIVHKLSFELFGCEFADLANIDSDFQTRDESMKGWKYKSARAIQLMCRS